MSLRLEARNRQCAWQYLNVDGHFQIASGQSNGRPTWTLEGWEIKTQQELVEKYVLNLGEKLISTSDLDESPYALSIWVDGVEFKNCRWAIWETGCEDDYLDSGLWNFLLEFTVDPDDSGERLNG